MKEVIGTLNAQGMKIALVVSRFNSFLTEQLVKGAVDAFVRLGGDEKDLLLVRVPGAYLASKYFPQTLLPMGLANAAGSLFSILVCVIAYAILTRREKRAQEAS